VCSIFISNYALPKWVREKVVVSVDASISFLGFLYFLVSLKLVHIPLLPVDGQDIALLSTKPEQD
jgi:hypothetical protein